MIDVVCPHCRAESRWKDKRWGENARCPSCGEVLTIVPPVIYETLRDERRRLREGARRTIPLVFVLENVRSAYNVGSILRTADGCGVRKVYLVGITPDATHPKVRKTALGADEAVPTERAEDVASLAAVLRQSGYRISAIEKQAGTDDLLECNMSFPAALLFGNEVSGLSPEALEASDDILSLPMLGVKTSLNVAAAAAVAGYFALCRFARKGDECG